MVKILFVRSENAFLPEIDAYVEYFNQKEGFIAYDSSNITGEFCVNDYDVVWEFKGLGGLKVKRQVLVHEYASLSIGRFPHLKNLMKSILNPKPDLRIFLNERVQSGFHFFDHVEYCLRDMGIGEKFLEAKSTEKVYDFVYIGEISRKRGVDLFLEQFVKQNEGKLCLIGNVDPDVYDQFKSFENLIFIGKIPHSQVAEVAAQAIYGINYMPDEYPYNIQTSTKLLEYVAMGLKVITSDYEWVRMFEVENDCSFYKLNRDLNNLSTAAIEAYPFRSNMEVNRFMWREVIAESGIEKKLCEIVEKKSGRNKLQ